MSPEKLPPDILWRFVEVTGRRDAGFWTRHAAAIQELIRDLEPIGSSFWRLLRLSYPVAARLSAEDEDKALLLSLDMVRSIQQFHDRQAYPVPEHSPGERTPVAPFALADRSIRLSPRALLLLSAGLLLALLGAFLLGWTLAGT